jgi:tetratricopeptide (TPR) repeat protein
LLHFYLIAGNLSNSERFAKPGNFARIHCEFPALERLACSLQTISGSSNIIFGGEMAKKIKVSRKKIKRPDEFLSFSDRIIKYLAANKNVAYGIASAIILVLLVANLANYSIRTRRAKAETLLAEARTILQTPLVDQLNSEQILKGAKNYSTSRQRNDEAIETLNKVITQFGSGQPGMEARYDLGQVYFNNGDYQKGISAYQDFLSQYNKRTDQPEFLKYSAYVGIAKDYYELDDYAKASEYFQKVLDAKKSGTYEAEATLGLARCMIMLKEYDKAREKLDAVVAGFPGSVYEQLAKDEMARLPAVKSAK